MADYDDRVGLIEDELPEQLPENLRSVREGHLTHRGATALFRTLRTLGPAATALLLGLVLLAAVTLAAFGGTARWSASAPVLLTDVLDPGPLQYWHCSKEEMNVPMQILDRSKAKRGPWDFDFLEVETGNYKRIVSLPSMEHDGFHGEKLNACAMNNLDEYIYCVLQVRKDKKYELYIVRVGIVDYDTKLAGIHFVARVRPGSIYSAAFDMEGTFYFGPKKLHVIKDLHLAEGKSFLLRSEAMNLMNAPSYKVHKDCQGADYAFWEKEVDGKKLKILWMLRDFKVTALDVTTPGQATCKVWKSDGIPSNTRGHYGAGWTFKKPDGSVAVYFSNNAGRGVYGIDHSRLDLNSDTIHMYKVGESEATSKNDGANCMSMSSVSPFKAEPPKFLAPIEEKPAVEEKTEPEPTKEKTPPPSKEIAGKDAWARCAAEGCRDSDAQCEGQGRFGRGSLV
ncbi:unnamed protein product [Durusdinium trenchii]|uniref:DUF6923 domain-containing protein n=1 Tax=Durusdinium trenchii TaxID=1381693 RepID=A0ABP0Q5S2_9DINO